MPRKQTDPELITFDSLMVAARTVYAEARSESEEGRLAVACVIWNRVRKRSWWGRTLETVCRKRWQFSCWNAEIPGQPVDRNYQAMMVVSYRRLAPYVDAVLKAQRVAGTAADPSKGACHYHTHAVNPRWSRGIEPDAIIGGHRFYVGLR